jgi:hypothetical protein
MKFFLFVLLIFIAEPMAAGHAGLQDAIDKNDMVKASAIINNLGVKDIYCPSTLSAANGKKLYGKRFSDNPDLLYSNCDDVFILAYTKDACNDKENIELCKKVLVNTPVDTWLPYIKQIHKNKLDKIPEQYEDQVEVKVKRSKEECALEMETGDNYITLSDALEFEGEKGYNRIYKKLMKDCMGGLGVSHKTIKKVRFVNPFEDIYVRFLESVTENSKKLVGFSKDDSEKIAFVKTLEISKDLDDHFVDDCTISYRDSSYVNDKMILSACRFFPNFDKILEKKMGFPVFSCKDALDAYSEKNMPICGLSSEDVSFSTSPVMEGAPVFALSCNKGVWGPFTQSQKGKEIKKTASAEQTATAFVASAEPSADFETEKDEEPDDSEEIETDEDDSEDAVAQKDEVNEAEDDNRKMVTGAVFGGVSLLVIIIALFFGKEYRL